MRSLYWVTMGFYGVCTGFCNCIAYLLRQRVPREVVQGVYWRTGERHIEVLKRFAREVETNRTLPEERMEVPKECTGGGLATAKGARKDVARVHYMGSWLLTGLARDFYKMHMSFIEKLTPAAFQDNCNGSRAI